MTSSLALSRLQKVLAAHFLTIDYAIETTLGDGGLDADQQYLAVLYNFVVAFEAGILYASGLELAFIRSRIRSGRIADELLARGLTKRCIRILAHRCRVHDLSDPIDALGWLFVVETITDQHPVFRSRMARRLDDPSARWGELGVIVDGVVSARGDPMRLESAAGRALSSLASVMDANMPRRPFTPRSDARSAADHG